MEHKHHGGFVVSPERIARIENEIEELFERIENIEKQMKVDKAESEENYSIKTVTNAEEAEEYQISEDISKGFEEFTKMMFKQGQKESEE